MKIHYKNGCSLAKKTKNITENWGEVTCLDCLANAISSDNKIKGKHIDSKIQPTPINRYTYERQQFGFTDRRQ